MTYSTDKVQYISVILFFLKNNYNSVQIRKNIKNIKDIKDIFNVSLSIVKTKKILFFS